MGARHARRIEEPIHEMDEKEQGPSTPEEYRVAIRAALNKESLRDAQQAAAEGHSRFPYDPELARLDRLLALPPARIVESSERLRQPDRTAAFRWLEVHGEAYRGQWIALGDQEIVAASPDLDDLLRTLRSMSPSVLPLLIHFV